MPNDNNGSQYRRLIDNATSRGAVNTPLIRALQYLARDLHEGGTTESTVAVGYWNRKIYVAKLGRKSKPTEMVEQIDNLLTSPIDDEPLETLMSVFDDDGAFPVDKVSGVGGGKTGFHAEMMLVEKYARNNVVSAWGQENLAGIYIAASQGACPGCAGFMNFKTINHTGVRINGKCSSRWLNPIDQTFCGSEVGLGLTFPNIVVPPNARWIG